MQWYFNLKTSVKLISAFVIISIILAFVGFYGLANLGKMNTSLDSMYKDKLVTITDISLSQMSYLRTRLDIRDLELLAETKEDKDKIVERFKVNKKAVEEKFTTFRKTKLSLDDQELIKKFDEKWLEYNKFVDQLIQLSYEGNEVEFKALLKKFDALGNEIRSMMTTIVDAHIKEAKQADLDGKALYYSTRTITITIILVATFISILFGYVISQIIARPLNRVVGLVGKVAAGDLRETSDINTQDEIGQLAQSVNKMIVSLRQIISGVISSSHSVAAASQQISAGSEDIASSTMNQAQSAQTMNELIIEFSEAINSVAQSAEMASELTSGTEKKAKDGGKIVNLSIEGMNKVNDQMSRLENDSSKIGEIIEVIDDIADQTNLLALNAAIEAARAGEQGRGFAVVADEVRKLAERSSEATKQITSIIKGMQNNTQQSVKSVLDSVLQTQQTGEAFDEIIQMINESSQKVLEIAAASEEQAAQSSEVMKAIGDIAAASEEAAAAAEQTAASSQSLAKLAEELNNSVLIFKLN